MQRSEREIQASILAFLATAPGVVAWKSGAGSWRATYKGKTRFVRIGRAGVSDIIGWQAVTARVPGFSSVTPARLARFIAVEVKRPGEPTTALQDAFLERVRRDGGIAVVATCVDDVARALGLAGATPGAGT